MNVSLRKSESRILPEHLCCLTSHEQRVYAALAERRRPEWLASRLAAKQVVQKEVASTTGMCLDFSQIDITSKEGGRPHFCLLEKKVASFDTAAYCLTLSHTRSMGGAALSRVRDEGLIGIDIETKRPWPHFLVQAFLTDTEQEQLSILGKDFATLFWSYKEAFLKALGTGLTLHPRRVETRLGVAGELLELLFDGQKVSVRGEKLCLSSEKNGVIVYILPYSKL